MAGTSRLYLLNVPWTNDYKHVVSFTNEEDQFNYISNQRPTVPSVNYFDSAQQVRHDQPYRINTNIDNMTRVNYVAYRNTTGGKWYYAFVTKVEYLALESCIIYLETDIWQTYHLQLNIHPCIVERMHSATDEHGDNTEPEPIIPGDYVYSDNLLEWQERYGIICCTSLSGDQQPSTRFDGSIINGTYNSLNYYYFPATAEGVGQLNGYLNNVNASGKIDEIVAIYMVPNIAFNEEPNIWDNVRSSEPSRLNYNTTFPADIDGYVPKNNKLFTYPFAFIRAFSHSSDGIFKYELINNRLNPEQINIIVEGDYTYPPAVKLSFTDYEKNNSANNSINSDRTQLTETGYPQCSYIGNSYLNYIAQNKTTNAVSSLSVLAGTVGAIASVNPAIGITKTAVAVGATVGSQLLPTYANEIDRGNQPNSIRGSRTSEALNMYLQLLKFKVVRGSITAEQAEVFDDFFTRCGYAYNKIERPNIWYRRYFDYKQTRDCTVTGNAPVDVCIALQNIFNNGVTVWHNTNYLYDYSVNNGFF